MTSLEMAGVSITLLHLDETRAHCLGKSCPVSKDHSVAKRVLAMGLHSGERLANVSLYVA